MRCRLPPKVRAHIPRDGVPGFSPMQVFGHPFLVAESMLRFAQRRALIGRATVSVARVARFAPAGVPSGATVLSLRAQSTSSGDKREITEAVAAWRKAPTAPLRFPVGAPVRCLVEGGVWATGPPGPGADRPAGSGSGPLAEYRDSQVISRLL